MNVIKKTAGRGNKHKRNKESVWERNMSPSFTSYGITNKCFHTSQLTASWLPWWGGVPIATAGGVVPWESQRRPLASDCLSVCLPVCLWISVQLCFFQSYSCACYVGVVPLISVKINRQEITLLNFYIITWYNKYN